MKQLILIGGGEAFENDAQFYQALEKKEYNPFKVRKKWKTWLGEELSDTFQVIEPEMPNKKNAKYKAWKIWFEKLFPYLNQQGVILVGSSLGGLFLAKYLSENNFPVSIDQLYFIAPVFNDEGLIDEYVSDFALDESQIKNIQDRSENITFYFSKDDPVVPFRQYENYKKYLPHCKYYIFEDRGHFSQGSFPELLEKIKKSV